MNNKESLCALFCETESRIWIYHGSCAREVMLSTEANVVVRLAGQIAARDIPQFPGPSQVSKEHLTAALERIDRVEKIVKGSHISLLKRWIERRPVGSPKNDHRKRNPAGPDFNGSGMTEFWGRVALVAESHRTEVDMGTLRTVLGVIK